MIINTRKKKFRDLKKMILDQCEPGTEMVIIELMHGLIFRIHNSHCYEDNIFISFELYNEHNGPWTDCYVSDEPSYLKNHYWVKQVKQRTVGDNVLAEV